MRTWRERNLPELSTREKDRDAEGELQKTKKTQHTGEEEKRGERFFVLVTASFSAALRWA
jgi:hypothetical protein